MAGDIRKADNRENPMTTQTNEDRTIRRALRILEKRLSHLGDRQPILSQHDAALYLVMMLAERKAEVFVVLFLDVRYRLIASREMFQGTVDQAAVYTREVLRAVIETNAVAVVLAHNHPAGIASPSEADRAITRRLVKALELIDVRVLDHIIVGGARTYSFAEHGLL